MGLGGWGEERRGGARLPGTSQNSWNSAHAAREQVANSAGTFEKMNPQSSKASALKTQ